MIKTFCDPLLEGRYDCRLRPGDIDNALEAFGPGLVKLYINPMYLEGKQKINYNFPEDLEVEGHAGVAGWELMGEVKGQKDFSHIANTPDNLNIFKATEEREKRLKGQKFQIPEKPVGEVVQDTTNNQQDVKILERLVRRGRKTPAEENKGVDFDCSASQISFKL